MKTDSNTQADEYNVIVDALFGVGLSRPVEGIYAEAVEEMNVAEGFRRHWMFPVGSARTPDGCLVVLSWQMQRLLLVSAREAL